MENVIDNKNILNVITEMSQQEIEKLMSIFQVMQRFEKEKQSSVMTVDESKEQGEKWLEDLKYKESGIITENEPGITIDKKPHSIILNAVINRCEVKIQKQEKAITEIKNKISIRESKINSRKNKIEGFESKINKYKHKFNRIDTENNFLQSILGGKHDNSARFIINSNKKKQLRLQKRISSLNLKITTQKSNINIQSAKISDLNNDISERETKIEKQRQKINKINDIIQKDMPHVALSYFLSERSGLSINELNLAIENPEEYFKVQEENKTPLNNDIEKYKNENKENSISKLIENVNKNEDNFNEKPMNEPHDKKEVVEPEYINENSKLSNSNENRNNTDKIVKEYEKWTNDTTQPLPNSFYYVKNTPVEINLKQELNLTASMEKTPWIAANDSKGNVLLFPNAELLDVKNYTMFSPYEFNPNDLKSSGLNSIHNIKPCIAEEGKIIQIRGKFELNEPKKVVESTESINTDKKADIKEQLELYVQFEGVEPSSSFNYTLENEKATYIKGSLNTTVEQEEKGISELKTKVDGVAYKEITGEKLMNLDGLVFLFKRNKEKTNTFIIKFNESDRQKIENALKMKSNNQPLQL